MNVLSIEQLDEVPGGIDGWWRSRVLLYVQLLGLSKYLSHKQNHTGVANATPD